MLPPSRLSTMEEKLDSKNIRERERERERNVSERESATIGRERERH